MLELKNKFLILKKDNMSIDEYTNALIEKMNFSLRIVPDELERIDRYDNGLPWE